MDMWINEIIFVLEVMLDQCLLKIANDTWFLNLLKDKMKICFDS